MGRKRTRPIPKPKYQFNVGEQVIYVGGLYSEHKNKIATILERNKSHDKEYYTIKFSDDSIIHCVISIAFIKIQEEDTKIII